MVVNKLSRKKSRDFSARGDEICSEEGPEVPVPGTRWFLDTWNVDNRFNPIRFLKIAVISRTWGTRHQRAYGRITFANVTIM